MNNIVQEDITKIIKTGGTIWENFAGKTILVTGANGMIPYYFVSVLLSLNEDTLKGKECRVIGLTRNKQKGETKLKRFIERKDFKLIVSDVSLPLEIDEPLHCIIHAASQANPKYYGIDPVGTILPNIIGTKNLLELARKKDCKNFLFLSSAEIYGILTDDKIPTKEEDYGWVDPLDVRSCYAEGKRAGESLCVAWHTQYGIPATIARLAHTYGPGLDIIEDGRVFANFIADVIKGNNITLNSNGSAIRSFCYISDAILGMFMVMLLGENGKAYNVCNDSAYASVLDLAKIIVDIYPEKRLKVVFAEDKISSGYIKSSVQRSILDSSKLRSLGWNPTIGIKEGFRRSIMSFEHNIN